MEGRDCGATAANPCLPGRRELRFAPRDPRGGHENRRESSRLDPGVRRPSRRARLDGSSTELLSEQPADPRAPVGALLREPDARGPRARPGEDREDGLRVLDESQLPHDAQAVLQVASGNDEEYPEVVRWIRTKNGGRAREKLPTDLLTPQEVDKLVEACVHARDKALVSLLPTRLCSHNAFSNSLDGNPTL